MNKLANPIVALASCLIACFSISLAEAAETPCDQFDRNITSVPSPPPSAIAWKVHAKEMAGAVHAKSDLLVIGDSLAEFWPAKLLSSLEVQNFGVGGDRTQQVLWRLQSLEFTKLNPRNVLIIVGTVNLGSDKACAISFGIRKIIERVSQLWPATHVMYLDIPPRGPDFKQFNETRLAINADVHSISTVSSVSIDDEITCGWRAPCVNYVNRANDFIHLSTTGYEVVGRVVRAQMK